MDTGITITLLISIIIATHAVSRSEYKFISRYQGGAGLLFLFPAMIAVIIDMNDETVKRMEFYRDSYVKTHVVVTGRCFDKRKGGFYFNFTEDGIKLPVFYAGDERPDYNIGDTLLINNIGFLSKMTTGEYDIKTGKWIDSYFDK